jgi:hypothetical protein
MVHFAITGSSPGILGEHWDKRPILPVKPVCMQEQESVLLK